MTDVLLERAPLRAPELPRHLIVLVLLTAAAVALGVFAASFERGAALPPAPPLRSALTIPTVVPPFVIPASNPAERERAVRCLTDAVYYEAAQEPLAGQRAIAQVVVNRVRDQNFPKTVCGVVYDGWAQGRGCAFSFVCDGSILHRHADATRWAQLRTVAEQALSGYVDTDVGTATHYHAVYVRPNWLRSVARTAAIGKHVFYSWRHKAGRVTALRFAYAGDEFAVPDSALGGLHTGA